MAEGRGRRNCWIPRTPSPTSQTRTTPRKTPTTGAASRNPRNPRVAKAEPYPGRAGMPVTGPSPGRSPARQPAGPRNSCQALRANPVAAVAGALTGVGFGLGVVAAQCFPNGGDVLEVALELAGLHRSGMRKVDVRHPRDPARAGGHDHDPGRE